MNPELQKLFDERAAKSYNLYKTGSMTWDEVAAECVYYNGVSAIRAARDYAKKSNLEWPIRTFDSLDARKARTYKGVREWS